MRAETPRQMMRLCAIAVVLAFLLATAAYSGSQTRSTTRSSRRTQSQTNQSQQNPTMSFQTGQPDMAQRMYERNMRQIQEMQKDFAEMQRQAEENKNRAIQQALHASDEQWGRLKPKLDRILRLKAEAEVSMSPGTMGNGNFQMQTFNSGNGSSGFMGGGFSSFGGSGGSGAPVDILDSNTPSTTPNSDSSWGGSTWTSNPRSVTEMSEGEVVCQDLQRLLQGQSAPSAEVSQKVAALRRVRAQARDNLAKARQELRTLVSPDQEPALILMGYLD